MMWFPKIYYGLFWCEKLGQDRNFFITEKGPIWKFLPSYVLIIDIELLMINLLFKNYSVFLSYLYFTSIRSVHLEIYNCSLSKIILIKIDRWLMHKQIRTPSKHQGTELFAKIYNGLKPLNTFAKSSALGGLTESWISLWNI